MVALAALVGSAAMGHMDPCSGGYGGRQATSFAQERIEGLSDASAVEDIVLGDTVLVDVVLGNMACQPAEADPVAVAEPTVSAGLASAAQRIVADSFVPSSPPLTAWLSQIVHHYFD
jgi:hypothetical protein